MPVCYKIKNFSRLKCILTTSIEDNLPNTVLESLSCGTPVVAFKTGGIPDMIIHKENGYLAEYKECSGIIEGLLFLLNSNEKENIRKNARNSIIKNFEPRIIAHKHISIYRKFLHNTIKK